MRVASGSVERQVDVQEGKIRSAESVNLITGERYAESGHEFAIVYFDPRRLIAKKIRISDTDMSVVRDEEDFIELAITQDGIDWDVELRYEADLKSDVVRKFATVKCSDPSVKIDYFELDSRTIDAAKFHWTIPKVKKRVFVPAYITTMGQPYYVGDMFYGGEFPMADNRIENGRAYSRYYIGRTFGEIAPQGEYHCVPFVVGAGAEAKFDRMRAAFFQYVSTICCQKAKFRVQFNSWYDHMLDINSEKITDSCMAVADGMKGAGMRPLDCYVVDDGWIDYKQSSFWQFDKTRFKDEFYNESELTKSLGSTFGVWFGPRGGYTAQTPVYARLLSKLGYHVCLQSNDICTGDPRYIADLCARMAEFCDKYNVSYFKIDGFAVTPCKSSRHGHPKGKGDGLYFYTFLWEEWVKGFEAIRKTRPDVFLNITSYAHCSPWFLKWCDAVWINNCGDMGYEGKGSNLDQCLNHRDGKYKDFFEVRQLQFPVANLYNHEPTYAKRNCNPAMTSNLQQPGPAHPTVVYSYEEFEKYMYLCMMRGSGFVELYFSPEMFDEKRWKIAARVLQWAEKNFRVLRNSQFFGATPSEGGVYGYYAFDKEGGKAIMSIRNSSDKPAVYALDNAERCFEAGAYEIAQYYPQKEECVCVGVGEKYTISLAPYEARIYEIRLAR